MINKKNRAIIEGAFFSAFCFIFSMINLITGNFFDILFIYLITIMMYLYRKKHDNKMSFIVLISSVFVTLLTGQIFFVLFLFFTLPVGIYLGDSYDKNITINKLRLNVTVFSIIKNILLFQVLSSLLNTESLIDAVISVINVDIFTIYFIALLTVSIVSFLESIVLVQYCKLIDIYLRKKK